MNSSIILIIAFELGFKHKTKRFKGDFYTIDKLLLQNKG